MMMIINLVLLFLFFPSSEFFVPVKTFVIDTDRSSATWSLESDRQPYSGMVFLSSGELVVHKAEISGGRIVVDMNSLSVSNVRDLRQNSTVTAWLKGPEIFKTYDHPLAVLRIASLWRLAEGQYMLNGTLSGKGMDFAIRTPASVIIERRQVEIIARITLDQSKIGRVNAAGSNFNLNLHVVAKK